MAAHSSVLACRIPGTGAWWAAIYGVTQSRTWMTWLSSSRRLRSTVPTKLYKLYFNFKLLIYLAKIFPFKLVYGQGKKITEQKSMRLILKDIHILPSHFLSQRPSQLTLELCLGITYTFLNIIIFFVNKWCHTLSNFIGCLFQIT